MKYIIGKDRTQTEIFPITMEQAIDQDHEVRIIDLFVDSPGVEKMGFCVDFGENGRSAYHPSTWYNCKSAPFKQYKIPACKSCPVRERCTTSVRNGKIVQRNKYVK